MKRTAETVAYVTRLAHSNAATNTTTLTIPSEPRKAEAYDGSVTSAERKMSLRRVDIIPAYGSNVTAAQAPAANGFQTSRRGCTHAAAMQQAKTRIEFW